MLPSGITILWFGTNATIPAGFTRDTDFDDKFLLACHSGHTSGGTIGGQASHTHKITGHTHVFSADISTSKGGVSTLGPGDGASPSGHTHVNETSNVSFTAITSATNNSPPSIDAIFITSNGTNDIPASGVGFFESGATGLFLNYTNARSYYIKGVTTGGDGGVLRGADSHTHTTTNHNHASMTSNESKIEDFPVVTVTRANTTNTHDHKHQVTFFTATTTLLSTSLEPTYKTLNSIINGSTGFTPAINGFIAIWKGKKSDIPVNWSEYTTHRDCFLRVWSGNTTFVASGGARTHQHKSSAHKHQTSVSAGSQGLTHTGTLTGLANGTHTHTWNVEDVVIETIFSTNEENYPPYINAYLIKYKKPTILAKIYSII